MANFLISCVKVKSLSTLYSVVQLTLYLSQGSQLVTWRNSETSASTFLLKGSSKCMIEAFQEKNNSPQSTANSHSETHHHTHSSSSVSHCFLVKYLVAFRNVSLLMSDGLQKPFHVDFKLFFISLFHIWCGLEVFNDTNQFDRSQKTKTKTDQFSENWTSQPLGAPASLRTYRGQAVWRKDGWKLSSGRLV